MSVCLYCSSNLKDIWPSFFQMFFCTLLPFLEMWLYICFISWYCPMNHWSSDLLSHFSLCFSLYSFYCYIFKFNDIFFCSVSCAPKIIQWTFHYSYCIFQLSKFHLVPRDLISSHCMFPFTFFNIFIIPILKSSYSNCICHFWV